MNEYGVFICRAQPFHVVHEATLRFALERAKQLIVVLGSANQARTVKNPWTAEEREEMVVATLDREERLRVRFVYAKDYLYNDNLWIAAVQEAINQMTDGSDDVVLIGHRKDASSFYLKLFPQWSFIETGINSDVDASKIRNLLFTQDKLGIKALVTAPVYDKLVAFMESPAFADLHEEYHHILDYRDSWKGAPFPPTFVTVDSVVICSGHVLVVRRRSAPGKGLIALPGGFLNQREKIIDGAVRELKEETGIRLPVNDLKAAVTDDKVFDHPDRSLRGRTITHAFCINLGHGELPRVKGDDDADKAWWMTLRDAFASEPRFFEDHYHIIGYFATKF